MRPRQREKRLSERDAKRDDHAQLTEFGNHKIIGACKN
jgi:hypothetical protein